jgi:hypothetical protein
VTAEGPADCRTSGFLGAPVDVTASSFSLPLGKELAAVGPDGSGRSLGVGG